ncbi:MAG: tetratricopeptide repeat protein [Deltaproteobacteria bacterium]|nr:tetratricopeptide repeat protein [Deltaproteobacteria bacterium]
MISNQSRIPVYLLLTLAVLIVFWPVQHYDFINLDDPSYVTSNPHVKKGLTGESVKWAFSTDHAGFWVPITWISLMADYQLYGLHPGGFHVSNVLFHLANTLLLFAVLHCMTGLLWRSAFVAALFGVHPLHVESVAWITERKDVLSGFFWMLTMWAYFRYTKQTGPMRYALVVLFFTLGLMSKPMLVTLPLVLFLLDYWPLGRYKWVPSHDARNDISEGSAVIVPRSLTFLFFEKVPLFALAFVSGILTLTATKHGGGLESLEALPLDARIANAAISWVSYMLKMIWPHQLAIFYPHAGGTLPLWYLFAAGSLLIVLSFFIFRAYHKPFLSVGWLWYLITLLPVIGLLQAGLQGLADRFTYIPLIGLFIIPAWGMPCLWEKWRIKKWRLSLTAFAVLLALMVCAGFQVRCWRDSVTLFTHALEVTEDNDVAHKNLGNALARQNSLEKAAYHLREAIRIRSDDADTHNDLGVVLVRQGKLEKALRHFETALRIKPDSEKVHYNLGFTFTKMGQFEKAFKHYSDALRIKPGFKEARHNMMALKRKMDRARKKTGGTP